MNKKGAILHWIIFGILAALGLFLVLTMKIEVKGLDGDWQLGFLDDYYLEAEKDLLKIDQIVKYAGWQAVLELGEKGGFMGESDCGKWKSYNLWNELDEWCASDVESVILARIREESWIDDYSEIKMIGSNLIGKGKESSLVSSEPYVKYTYDTSFNVDLGFDVKGEYETLFYAAMDLVKECRGIKDLEECVEGNNDWNRCDGWEFGEEERKAIFCVEEAEVYGEKGLTPVRYRFALDFTALES